jgi:CDP-6-deoxy-D-xylo-4-hexulose-3-dehydrase
MVEKLKNWGRDCWCLPGHTNMCGKRFDHQWESMPEGYDHKYTFTEIGYNLKTTDLQAALGISQFSKIHNIVASRLANYHNLKSNILNYDISTIEYDPKVCVPSPFGFPIHVNSQAEFSRNELIRYLETNKIRTRPIFSGNIVRQPVMKKIEFAVAEPLTGSDAIMNEMFWIGCHPEITHEHLNYVKDVFNKFFDEKR